LASELGTVFACLIALEQSDLTQQPLNAAYQQLVRWSSAELAPDVDRKALARRLHARAIVDEFACYLLYVSTVIELVAPRWTYRGSSEPKTLARSTDWCAHGSC